MFVFGSIDYEVPIYASENEEEHYPITEEIAYTFLPKAQM